MKVWVGIYDHRHGTDVAVYETDDAAYHRIAEVICRPYWQDAVEATMAARDGIPVNPPDDDRECVELYFDVMREDEHPEFITIEQREVLSEERVNELIAGLDN